jgi:hypothetical protein
MLTDFVAADDIEATAHRTGFVQRTSKMTGKPFLALVTFGAWSEAKTTLAPLAAKATQLCQPVTVSPEAMHQRMNKKAMAVLQDILRPTLTKLPSLEPGCDDGLFPAFTTVYIADSTGVALPHDLHKTFPGAGGSAATAGAKLQAVWDDKSSLFGHWALTPGNIPEQRSIDQVVALAQKGMRFIFDLGYCKLKALASIATAGAYCFCRLNHQTNIYQTVAGRLCPMKLAEFLTTVEHDCPLLEKSIYLGATKRVAARLMAVRRPEAIVNKRRRIARKNAQKKGYTPSQAHLTLMSWHLLRHFQALAARGMQAIFQSELELHRFLQRACAAAERLAAKASRKRRTTAQILQEDFRQPLESVASAAAVSA